MSALLNQIMFWVNVVTEKSNISDVQHEAGPIIAADAWSWLERQ